MIVQNEFTLWREVRWNLTMLANPNNSRDSKIRAFRQIQKFLEGDIVSFETEAYMKSRGYK